MASKIVQKSKRREQLPAFGFSEIRNDPHHPSFAESSCRPIFFSLIFSGWKNHIIWLLTRFFSYKAYLVFIPRVRRALRLELPWIPRPDDAKEGAMSFRLFPKAPKFFEFFREQNRIIVEAATVLNTILLDFGDCDVRCQMINRLEADGDALNRKISQLLSTTFITPIDREDIHLINSSQETILNHIQAISNRIGVYEFTRMRFPAQRMVSNVKDMVTAIGFLLGMLENKGEVAESLGKVKHQKKECEMLLLSGLGELYDNPNPSPAEMMEIIKWTHVYDRIDKAFNRAWQLAKAIEGIVLKNA
jgi:hypothetical protein